MHPLAPVRSGFNALKRLVLFLAYARVSDSGTNPLWSSLQYPGPRHDRPQLGEGLALAQAHDGSLQADVVIVGSGAGGGVAAALYARAGYRTIVLEAGPSADAIAHEQREAGAIGSPGYLESGLAATTDVSVVVLAGACVGGGTTVNWSTSLRLRDAVMRQWQTATRIDALGAELADAYAAVEARPSALATAPHNANNAVIARGCERLGWSCVALPRNASGCGDGCGYCGFGCAYGNKRGVVATYLAGAVRDGAKVYPEVRVERVLFDGVQACGVEAQRCVTVAGSSHVEAPLVVLAAGALRTPGILARSGVRGTHLGKHLRLHPVGALSAEFTEPIEPWAGPIQTAMCERLGDRGDGYGVAIECAPGHPGLAALAIPWQSAEQHANEVRRLRNAAVLIALTRDRGEGSVSLDGRDDIRYALSSDDAERLNEGLIAAATIALAAGAQRVSTFHARPVVIERGGGTPRLDEFAAALRVRKPGANRSIIFSAHQMGTARMNADPRAGAIDAYGGLYGRRGVLVADSSAFPLASGVNPMLTIMALAHRFVVHALKPPRAA